MAATARATAAAGLRETLSRRSWAEALARPAVPPQASAERPTRRAHDAQPSAPVIRRARAGAGALARRALRPIRAYSNRHPFLPPFKFSTSSPPSPRPGDRPGPPDLPTATAEPRGRRLRGRGPRPSSRAFPTPSPSRPDHAPRPAPSPLPRARSLASPGPRFTPASSPRARRLAPAWPRACAPPNSSSGAGARPFSRGPLAMGKPQVRSAAFPSLLFPLSGGEVSRP